MDLRGSTKGSIVTTDLNLMKLHQPHFMTPLCEWPMHSAHTAERASSPLGAVPLYPAEIPSSTPRRYLRLRCAYLYFVKERDLDDAKFMRESFGGQQICSMLKAVGCEVEMMSLCRSVTPKRHPCCCASKMMPVFAGGSSMCTPPYGLKVMLRSCCWLDNEYHSFP